MKILVLFTFDVSLNTWHQQGLLDRELLIYKKMIDAGHKVSLLTYGDKRDLGFKKDIGGIDVFPVYSYMKRHENKFIRFFISFIVPFKLASIFRTHDIYKTNQMLGAWAAVLGKLLYRKRLVVRCGYEWLRNTLRESNRVKKVFVAILGWPYEFFTYMISDRIIASSSTISDFIKRIFFQPQNKISLISNFVDMDIFKKIDAPGFHEKKVLYIGRINKVKNLANLITAVKGAGLGLDIIGSGESRKKLEQCVEGDADVRFFGNIPNSQLPAYINRYPVFALVSLFENNPKSLLEAMACERVVVASNVDGIHQLVENNASGILVQTDIEGIKTGLKKAFSLTEEERLRMGAQARSFAAKTISLNVAFKKEMDAYNGLS